MKNQVEHSKKNSRVSLISLLILILLLFLFWFMYQCDNVNDREIKLEGTTIELKEPITENGEVLTEIPGYADMKIDKSNREIRLINPEHNQVLFKYTIICNGKSVYQTEYIAPGHMVKTNLYEHLDHGKYSVTLKLETRDIQSNQVCNSANIHLNLTVEK